jgi:integrase
VDYGIGIQTWREEGKGLLVRIVVDHTGKRRTKSTNTTDKATAERIARKYEADAALRREGVIDPTLDSVSQESRRSMNDHLTDFEHKLQAANRTDKHIRVTIKFIRRIAEHAGFETAADIHADGVHRYAVRLRDQGRSARTIQSHLAAIKSFTKWLTENHKLPRDPLASVKKPNPKADRRRERRILLPDEWRRLEAATESGRVRYGMTGAERVLLYRTAVQTGLRSNELRSLTRGQLFFESDTPYITCKARSTKNRQDARQYIPPELAFALKAHIATKTPKAPVFGLPHESNLARMLRDDLAEARKAWLKEAKDDPREYAQREESDFLADTNHQGEIVDFHSLRHSCGAWLAMTGAHPKVVQTVMRHQSITLTMDTYGHLFPGQEADAVMRLSALLRGSEENVSSGAMRRPGWTIIASQPLRRRSAWRSRREANGGEGVRQGARDRRMGPRKRKRLSP